MTNWAWDEKKNRRSPVVTLVGDKNMSEKVLEVPVLVEEVTQPKNSPLTDSLSGYYGKSMKDLAIAEDGELAKYDKTLGSKGGKQAWHKCYEKHPLLKIIVGENVYTISGGTCNFPPPIGTDILIGFDYGMVNTLLDYPWEPGVAVRFMVSDGKAPEDPKQYKKLVAWTAEQILAGKKVHTGCIGGHGRTGMFLAALVKYMTGNENAIGYVRDNYCESAVETTVQVKFLAKYFDIKERSASKEYIYSGGYGKDFGGKRYNTGFGTASGGTPLQGGAWKTESLIVAPTVYYYSPVKTSASIYGDNKIVPQKKS
jgi:hypothetical protein